MNKFCVPPSNFLFDFEISRLNFTVYGTYKNMNPAKIKMLIGSFVIVRVLIYDIILRPWNHLTNIKPNELLNKNIRNVASVLMQDFLDYVKSNLPINLNNQEHVSSDKRVKPRS